MGFAFLKTTFCRVFVPSAALLLWFYNAKVRRKVRFSKFSVHFLSHISVHARFPSAGSETAAQTAKPLRPNDGQSGILERLGKPEKNSPHHCLHSHRYGKKHLSETQQIERHTGNQNPHPGTERQSLQPCLDGYSCTLFHNCKISKSFPSAQMNHT